MRRLASCVQMIYCNARDGQPSTDHENRIAVDNGGTSRKT